MAIDGGLRAIFRRHIPDAHWTTIESGSTEAGIPDSEYCLHGVSGWLEMKQTTGWAVRIRPFQVGWIEHRMRVGGKVYVAVRRLNETATFKRDEIWMLHPSAARLGTLKGLGLDHVLAFGSGGPERWPWGKIRELLRKPQL